jgi:4-amino-4-deoxy-L-arabinose transferase-like glycosyltransferase
MDERTMESADQARVWTWLRRLGGANHGARARAIVAALLILALYLFAASRASLWDRDEGWYCRAAAEMIESGNYLYPTFNGEFFPAKPPLMYWLMAAAIKVLGPTELACRVFPAIGAAVGCLLIWWIGRALFDERTGLWAMLVSGTSLMLIVVGQLATTDAILLPLVIGPVACFVAAVRRGPTVRQFVTMAVLNGLAMLDKGPIGLVPLAVIGATLGLGRKNLRLGWRYFLLCAGATLIGAACYVVWAVQVDRATGGRFWEAAVGKHWIGLALSPMNGHGGDTAWKYALYLPYYIPATLVMFFPWALHLPAAVSATLGGRLGGPVGKAFLLAAVGPVLLAMTLAATKLPPYVLPIWLGLSLAVAAMLQAWRAGTLVERDRKWLRRGVWLLGPMGAIGGLAAIAGPWLAGVPQARIACGIGGALILVFTAGAIWVHQTRGPLASAKWLAGGMAALVVALGLLVSPELERCKAIKPLVAQMKEAVPAGAPLATFQFDEPTVYFYADRMIVPLGRRGPRAAIEWLSQPADGAMILTADGLAELQASGYRPPPGALVASQRHFNLGNGRWVELMVLVLRPESPGPKTPLPQGEVPPSGGGEGEAGGHPHPALKGHPPPQGEE